MIRVLRILLITTAVVLAVVLVIVGGIWLLVTRTPDFYEKKVPVDPALAKKACDQFLQKTSLFASDLKREGTWYLKVTEEEINGWLAVDLPRNHTQALPRGIWEPRVEIGDDIIRVAAQAEYGHLRGVAHVELQLYSTEANTITVVVKRAALGALPLPLQDLVEQLKKIAARAHWDVRQMQTGGSPTLVITIPKKLDEKGRELELTTIHITPGTIELIGKIKGTPQRSSAVF
ncbi:MAG: hypothetical protein WBH86_10365 [Thermogutta sp.]|nr:hypothetical protein [Thermogutta sp.]HPU05574.1 hypothetical protein [Thermogutta sp.]HQF13486.1 hypothetical protein [Thermogutta sp.]